MSVDSEGVISSAIMAEEDPILRYLPPYKAVLTDDWDAADTIHHKLRSMSDDSEGVISSAIMAEDEDRSYILRYLPLYKAALTNDWEATLTFLEKDPTADLTANITIFDETALHIAVGAKTSNSFVTKLVDHITNKNPDDYPTKLSTPDCLGNTALHFAAKVGNTDDAGTLLEKNSDLHVIKNNAGVTPMKLAAWYGHKDTLEYLWDVTLAIMAVDVEYGLTQYLTDKLEKDLLTILVTAGFYEKAFSLMYFHYYPGQVNNSIIMDDFAASLRTLATQPKAFPSGRNWWFLKNLIYSWIPVREGPFESMRRNRFSTIIEYVPFLKSIRDAKLVEKQADELMKAMIKRVIESSDHKLVWDMLGTTMHQAAKYGIHEFIEECVSHYPGLIWYHIDNMFLFMVAIEYRQVKVYNLHYQMTGHSAQAGYHTNNENNLLHLAAKKASPDRLNTITGAALQMQRELQWFKDVEKFVNPSYKKALNADKKTPQTLFTEEHRDLVERGEKWMKDTATSSTVVAALIVTVAFAAIFTVPGGNADNGKPNFILDAVFVVFAVVDSLALFSSITSVLMFTALLTSRYSEDDFLYALPKRMTIGLMALFISIASIMITFCAALVLVMRAKISWIAVPAGVVAVVPITCFALLQFPLLVELVLSTFGPNIFHKQKNVILH